MARNSSGVYQIPSGTLGVPNTVIRSDAYNAFVQDVAAEITASLPRDGRAGMTGKLALSAAGFGFVDAPTTSFYYDAARNGVGLSVGGVEVAFFTASKSNLNNLGAVNVMQPGMLFHFAGPTPPVGSLLCAGQEVARSAYPALFTAIGGYWGNGDGSTTFNLPDLRGYVLAGLDNMGGADAARLTSLGIARISLGARAGSDAVILSLAQMPNHDHGGTVTGDGNHQHPVDYQRTTGYGGGAGLGATNTVGQGSATDTGVTRAGTGQHGHGIPAQGGNQAHANVQPTGLCNICIQAF